MLSARRRFVGLCASTRCLLSANNRPPLPAVSTAKLRTSSVALLDVNITPDNVVKSPFPDIQIPETNLFSLVYRDFSKFGNKVALVNGATGREFSYSELESSTTKLSSALNRMGMQKGDVLSIVAPNRPEYSILFFATLASGGIVSTCNPTYTVDELVYQFKNSGAKFVATVPEILPTVQTAAEQVGVENIIVVDDTEQSTPGLISYRSLLEDTGSRFNPASVDAKNDIAVLPYSSGTTGLPKGVMLTHYNVTANLLQLENPELFPLSQENTCLLGLLPFFHIYGMVVILFSSLFAGSRCITLPNFESELFLSTIEKYKINCLHLVPPLVLFLAKHPSVDKYDISCIDSIMSGAAPLGGDTVKSAHERVGCRLIRQGYGLTETSPVTHVMPNSLGMSKPSSIGVLLSNEECKSVDSESGEALPIGKEGEILIRGPNVMKGYLNNPEANAATLTPDGWFHTGDMGYFDEDGCFYITDRLKELIKVKGLQVAPAELEATLLTHPKVGDAAVIGVPHEWQGEAPKAFIVKKDQSVTEKELIDFIASKLAVHKHLVGGVEFIEAVPKSASGKILRRTLKKTS